MRVWSKKLLIIISVSDKKTKYAGTSHVGMYYKVLCSFGSKKGSDSLEVLVTCGHRLCVRYIFNFPQWQRAVWLASSNDFASNGCSSSIFLESSGLSD